VHEHLYSAGWIDRSAGVAHIPIDRAMDLILVDKDPSAPQSDKSEASGADEKNTPLQSAGRELFRKYGCDVCHSPDAHIHVPSLVGIFGEKVRLSDGMFVRADDQYLRNSILHAGIQLVAGYPPIIRTFSGYIPEPDVLGLMACLKSFKGTKGDPASSP
jgi:cytochrome c oxidase subunit 2